MLLLQFAPNPSKKGELKVRFNNIPSEGSYWIIALGPIYNGLYDWAIVSDQYSYSLFVLVRDVGRFNTLYKAEIDAKLKQLGFGGLVAIYQGPECVYSELSV